MGDGEGSATATAKVRNAFGGGETVEGNLSFGTRTRNAFQVRLSSSFLFSLLSKDAHDLLLASFVQVKFDTPLFSSPTTRFDLTLFQAQRDLNFYASCCEGTKGLMARVRGLGPWGVHEVAYEAVLRQVGEIAPGASMRCVSFLPRFLSLRSSLSSCLSSPLSLKL